MLILEFCRLSYHAGLRKCDAESSSRVTMHSCPRLKDITMSHEEEEGADDQARISLTGFSIMT